MMAESNRISIMEVIQATIPPARILTFVKKALLGTNIRYSPDANIVVTILCSLIAQEIITYAIKGATETNSKRVKPGHVFTFNIQQSPDWIWIGNLKSSAITESVEPTYKESYGLKTYIKRAFDGIAETDEKYSSLAATDELKVYIENILIEFIDKLCALCKPVLTLTSTVTIKDSMIMTIINMMYVNANQTERYDKYKKIIDVRLEKWRAHKDKTDIDIDTPPKSPIDNSE